MYGSIFSEKYIALAALFSSIFSLYLAVSTFKSKKKGKFLVSINVDVKTKYESDNFHYYGYMWLTIRRYSCRHCGSISIVNLSETARTIETVLLKLPNSSPENPELEYLIISKQPIMVEPEGNYIIRLEATTIDIPSYLSDSQEAYVVIFDMYGEEWSSKEKITVGALRKLKKVSKNAASSENTMVW
jgi:hypothetical protein